ncbi:MAG: siroheme synthase CysG [Anderseniella sp.]|jgi:uroporphyrin-III C-methyltransferase/precorrin-2 dehydrogenase/sirohydrochlorin ferrochelatase|nr:siroheme synthase CysG [Anderseniella sp.]
MRYYPVFLDLEGRTVVIAGGGAEAAQKLRLMAKTPARVVVVAPFAEEELCQEIDNTGATWLAREFDADDLHGAALVFACGLEMGAENAVVEAAKSRNIPVNVVDVPEKCAFITPAIVERGALTVAIGTGGAAPVLGQGLKARIEAMLPSSLGGLIAKGKALRPRVAASLEPGAARRSFWREFYFGAIADAHERGSKADFKRQVDAVLNDEQHVRSGSVALIGAGPGDPDLLTLKAQRALREADVIVFDRLVGERVLDQARRDAERINVGKAPGGRAVKQGRINEILIEQAKLGKRVVRLKGGDPYVFGRGGEEQEALLAEGIPVEVVPGITAAMACAASVRLPLTMRGETRAFTVLTGTAGDGAAEHDWRALAQKGQAFAVYMGVRQAGHIQAKLLEAGIDPDTPAVVVEKGTLPEERHAVGTVATLTRTLALAGIKGPAIIYVGLNPARSDVLAPLVATSLAAAERIAS